MLIEKNHLSRPAVRPLDQLFMTIRFKLPFVSILTTRTCGGTSATPKYLQPYRSWSSCPRRGGSSRRVLAFSTLFSAE